jgi:hypothetical protein
MLAGLQAAAAALNNGQGLAAIHRNNLNVSSTRSRFSGIERAERSAVFEQAMLNPEPANQFTIKENIELIPIETATQTVIADKLNFAELSSANRAINLKMEQRAFFHEAQAHPTLNRRA